MLPPCAPRHTPGFTRCPLVRGACLGCQWFDVTSDLCTRSSTRWKNKHGCSNCVSRASYCRIRQGRFLHRTCLSPRQRAAPPRRDRCPCRSCKSVSASPKDCVQGHIPAGRGHEFVLAPTTWDLPLPNDEAQKYAQPWVGK